MTKASITDRARPLSAETAITDVHFLGRTAAFVLAEESAVLVTADAERTVVLHEGGVLCSAGDGRRLITGGDDGKVMAVEADGEPKRVATDAKRRWIDRIAAASDGTVAWSAGKQVFVSTARGEERVLDLASSAGGLAFAPKGFRLAIAHYGGVTLWFPNAAGAKPEFLEWKGSHHAVTFSPDGRFLITTMQEPMLHGWRLADGKHMRMSGYAGRVRSLAWTVGGQFLATSGSDQLILWPFQSKDGPMGKEPRLLAPYGARVTVVAAHPKQPVVAAGFADGMVLLVRIDDGAELVARRPGDAPVTALAFSADGSLLACGCEDGAAAIVDL